MNSTQKYRKRLKRAGFLYKSFWIHKDDIEEVKDLIESKKLKYAIAEMQRLAETYNQEVK